MAQKAPAAVAALEEEVKQKPVPKHVAIIMDGNGRWAEAQGKNRIEGHREGSNSVRDITRCARRVGLSALTLYAFSSQNWARPPFEVTALMDLLREYLIKERDELMDNDIKLNAIGELDRLPGHVREPLEALRRETSKNKSMVLTLALSYGGREELLHATRALAKKAKSGELNPEKISEADFEKALWTHGLPAVDLMIRTSGELRISNYLLWQLAYAELMFVDVAWPDFRDAQLLECLRAFQTRERRFGLTGAQVKGKA